MIKSLLLFTLLCFASISNAQLTSDSLIGIWQDMPSLGSGWSENYRFFDDGTFIHSNNQMDCADSIISKSGRFQLKKNKLILRYSRMQYIAGGTLQKSTGSCGSEYELVGGTETETFYKEKVKIKLLGYIKDLDYDYLDCITLDGARYWRLGSNPKEYY